MTRERKATAEARLMLQKWASGLVERLDAARARSSGED